MPVDIPPPQHAIVISVQEQDSTQLIQSMQRVNHKIFCKLATRYPDQSISFSPLSLFSLLSCGVYGQVSDTSLGDHFLQSLCLGHLDALRYHSAFHFLLSSYGQSSPLSLTNALFTTIPLDPAFIALSRDYYRAEVFSGHGNKLLAEINSWVNQHTRGLIPHLLDSLPNDLGLCVLNAVAFQAHWQTSFLPADSYALEFTSSDGRTQPVKVMKDRRKVIFREELGCKFIELPFQDEDFSYCICMPTDSSSLDNWIQKMDIPSLLHLMRSARLQLIDISLPKQNITFDAEYLDLLAECGLPVYDVPHLASVFQKVKVLVHEEGVEAAAVTGAVCTTSLQHIPSMHIDRPFLYWVMDKKRNIVLFQGCVRDFTPFQVG